MYQVTDRQSAAFLVEATTPRVSGDSLLLDVVQARDPDAAACRDHFLAHILSSDDEWSVSAKSFTGETSYPTSAALAGNQLTIQVGQDSGKRVGQRSSKTLDDIATSVLETAAASLWMAGDAGAPLSFAQLVHGLPEYSERFSVVAVRVIGPAPRR